MRSKSSPLRWMLFFGLFVCLLMVINIPMLSFGKTDWKCVSGQVKSPSPALIPLVYTYTEDSAAAGQQLLKISILSVRQHMPTHPINILYHRDADLEFRAWLQSHNVMIHNHQPTWKDKIEQLRLAGDDQKSHLFAHAGNYMGTWQRIDIPKYITAEYCLFLDSDVIIVSPLTLQKVRRDTEQIAFSNEMNENELLASNAGVALMNVSYLRTSYDAFLEYIHKQKSPDFDGLPSDQGAYLTFYNVSFLPRVFNMKPYWEDPQTWEERKIIHFHGMKPHDIIHRLLGGECTPAIRILCNNLYKFPYMCLSLQQFAETALSGGVESVEQYCRQILGTGSEGESCIRIMVELASVPPDPKLCEDTMRQAADVNRKKTELSATQSRVLSFPVCNGLANQRLSFIYGLVFARMTGRDPILPEFLADGTQLGVNEEDYLEKVVESGTGVSFSNFYDLNSVTKATRKHGVRVRSYTVEPAQNLTWEFDVVKILHSNVTHVQLPCTLFRVPATNMSSQKAFVMDVLAALVPAPSRAMLVNQLLARFLELTEVGQLVFDVVHLRYETDWVKHCQKWVGTNCGLLSAELVISQLRAGGIGKNGVPVYVATQLDTMSVQGAVVFEQIRRTFNIVTKGDLDMSAYSREESALLEYVLCKRARHFMGNSVSTFSALLVLERHAENLHADWYNGGDVPLHSFLPFFGLPHPSVPVQ